MVSQGFGNLGAGTGREGGTSPLHEWKSARFGLFFGRHALSHQDSPRCNGYHMTAQTLTTSPAPELVRYVRVTDITTTAKRKGILPISPSTLWRLIKAGSFPKPVRLSSKVVAWRASDITAWLAAREQAGAVEGGEQ